MKKGIKSFDKNGNKIIKYKEDIKSYHGHLIEVREQKVYLNSQQEDLNWDEGEEVNFFTETRDMGITGDFSMTEAFVMIDNLPK